MVGGSLEGGEAATDSPLLAVFCVVFHGRCFEVEGVSAGVGGSADHLVRCGQSCVVEFHANLVKGGIVRRFVYETADPSCVAI